MIKKVVFLIFILSATVSAQDDVQRIVLKYGKHPDFHRFVLICEKPEITYSINVKLMNDGKIKLTFPTPFEIELASWGDLKFFKEDKTLIFGTSNITKIKISRYESPSRLVIDAYFESVRETKSSILIDPGHGGEDSGLQWKETNEKNLVLYVSKEIASKLAQKGIKTSLTRATDENLSLKKRLKIENSLKPSLFLSIHLSDGDYFIIYTSQVKKNIPKDDPSKIFLNEDNLVKLFMKRLKEKFSEPVYTEKLPATLLKEATAPALMIEIPKRALFSDRNYINKITDVFVQVILENFKIKDRSQKDE